MNQSRSYSPRYLSRSVDVDQAAAQIAALHATARPGKFICLARRGTETDLFGESSWSSEYLPVEDVTADRLTQLLDAAGDWYIAPASLWKEWRNAKAVETTGSVWVDLDWYKVAAHKGKPASSVLLEIGAALDAAGIPRPSMTVSSGRGHQLYWLFDRAVSAWPSRDKRDGQADPSRLTAEVRRERMFDGLVEALAGFGPDRAPRNRCAVLRLAGTINQKGGRSEIVQMSNERFSFETLARAVLKPRRPRRKQTARAGRLASFSAAKAVRDQAAGRLNFATRARAILDDISGLLDLRYGERCLPAGRRDLPAFHQAVAWSQLVGADALAAMITETGGWTRGGWTGTEALANLGAVIRLSQRREKGDAEARYRIPVSRIITELEITESEMRAAGLRILVTGDVRRENTTERKRQSRGSVSRAEYREQVQAGSLAQKRPWDAQGISRATWYRLKKERAGLTAANDCPKGRAGLWPADCRVGRFERSASALSDRAACASLLDGGSGSSIASPSGKGLRQGGRAPLLHRDNRVSPAENLGFGAVLVVDSIVSEIDLVGLAAGSESAWRYVVDRIARWHEMEAALSVGEGPPPPISELLSYARQLLDRAAVQGLG